MKNKYLTLLLIALAIHPVGAKDVTPAQEIVAATLILEAGGEPTGGMLAVYEVIRNRSARSNRTLLSECYRRKQFSCWNDVSARPKLLAYAKTHRKFSEAIGIVTNNPPSNLTKGSTHYHATRVNPYWALSMKKTVVVGKHIFYHDKK